MAPLIVLLVVFALAALTVKLGTGAFKFPLPARIAMCSMLLFTAVGHFAFAEGMAMMIPAFIPFKTELVYLTGLLEILLGVGLLFQRTRKYAAWLLIVFFILVLPANIKAALEHVDYQTGSFDGPGPDYLWFRIPLQIFFIVWTYLSSIRSYIMP